MTDFCFVWLVVPENGNSKLKVLEALVLGKSYFLITSWLSPAGRVNSSADLLLSVKHDPKWLLLRTIAFGLDTNIGILERHTHSDHSTRVPISSFSLLLIRHSPACSSDFECHPFPKKLVHLPEPSSVTF